ncbi:hypothetical protein KEJ21_04305 [Candidatus Bathyarchaeota archaeon]|nr:hypothetical protein [Candidatus Bathyarchaeota archaeon]
MKNPYRQASFCAQVYTMFPHILMQFKRAEKVLKLNTTTLELPKTAEKKIERIDG